MLDTRLISRLQRAGTTQALQPQNQPGRRRKTVPQTHLLPLTSRAIRTQRISGGKRQEWFHLPQQVAMGLPSTICEEERWQPPPMRGLPHTQQGHGEGSLPTPTNSGPAQLSCTSQDLHEDRPQAHLPSSMHHGRRRTKDGLPYLLQVIQMVSYAIRPH